jgi:hypothetical protein
VMISRVATRTRRVAGERLSRGRAMRFDVGRSNSGG